jgi:hypothetical protein
MNVLDHRDSLGAGRWLESQLGLFRWKKLLGLCDELREVRSRTRKPVGCRRRCLDVPLWMQFEEVSDVSVRRTWGFKRVERSRCERSREKKSPSTSIGRLRRGTRCEKAGSADFRVSGIISGRL